MNIYLGMQSAAQQRPQQIDNEEDAFLMQVALKEAKKGEGKTSPNPIVGAVIACDGKILSKGFHSQAGGPHAEIEVLSHLASPFAAQGATLYVTLEPCSTHGKTPSCTQAIIDAGIGRVVYGATDPNPVHQGRADKILSEAGIEVVTGVLKKECQELNKYWNHRIQTGLPWVIAKYGMSLDGRISSFPGRRWITSEKSRRDAMRLRAHVEAIFVGGGTIRHDDPELTIRSLSKKKKLFSQPWRIVWSRSGDIPRSARVLTDAHCGKTIVLKQMSLRRALQDVGARGISSVLIEGGGYTLGEAFDHQLVDEVRLYVAPILIGGPVLAVGGMGLGDKISGLTSVSYRMLGEDLVISGLIKKFSNKSLPEK